MKVNWTLDIIKHWPLANSTSPVFVVDASFMFVLIIISGMGSTGAQSHMWHSDNKESRVTTAQYTLVTSAHTVYNLYITWSLARVLYTCHNIKPTSLKSQSTFEPVILFWCLSLSVRDKPLLVEEEICGDSYVVNTS